jgi:hypothetical protein
MTPATKRQMRRPLRGQLDRRKEHSIVTRLSRCSRTWCTGVPSRGDLVTGDGAGILTQIPTPFPQCLSDGGITF